MDQLWIRDGRVYLNGFPVFPSQVTLHMDANTGKATAHLVLPVEVEANMPAIEARVIPTQEH